VSEVDLESRAARAWHRGDHAEALRLLKSAVRGNPDSLAARRSLAELYRKLGNPDQAGRWGIVFDGWTTALERDRLARLLAASNVDETSAARFLLLPEAGQSPTLAALVSGPVAVYRERFAAREESRRPTVRDSRVSAVSFALWAALAFVAVVGAGVLYVLAAVDSSAPLVGRLFLLAGGGLLALASGASAVGSPGRIFPSLVWTSVAVAAGALSIWGAASGWLGQ